MAQVLAQHRTVPVASDCDGTLMPPLDEATLLRDVLFILQGLDGQFVRFRPDRSPRAGPRRTFIRGDIVLDGGGVTDEVDEAGQPPVSSFEYAGGIDFVLEDSGASISAPARALIHSLSELGWLYRTIDRRLHDAASDEEDPDLDVLARQPGARRGRARRRKGMVEQSLHAELQKETTDYFKLVSSLETRLEGVEEPGAEGSDAAEGDVLSGQLTLRKLEVWTRDVRLRMRLMGALAADIGGTSALHRSLWNEMPSRLS